jgi:hypothetical protein
MSWELTRFVLSLQNLTPTEKAVAHSLAYHATKHSPAYPSMETIARESSLRSRRAAQKVVRILEAKGVISPTSSKKGGRKNPTRYRFNLGNSEPTDALSGTTNSEPGDPNLGETANQETRNSEPGFARDSRDRKAVDSSESTTTAFSEKQMEDELQLVWDYYCQAFRKEESFSPSKKKMGATVLVRMHEQEPGRNVVHDITCAIDMVAHIVKRNPKKAYFASWPRIFAKWNTFVTLLAEYNETPDVSAAAELPEPPETEQEMQQRIATEKADQERMTAERERNAARTKHESTR